MSCEICDGMKSEGSAHINEAGRFIFFLEVDEYGAPSIMVRDQYNEVGGDGIYLNVSHCPFCGEEL